MQSRTHRLDSFNARLAGIDIIDANEEREL
jgi:hypothetical protein